MRHSGRFISERPPHSVLVRGIERELLPLIQEYGMGTLVWSPPAGGWLSGRWREGIDAPQTARASLMGGQMASRRDLSDPVNQRKLDAIDAIDAIDAVDATDAIDAIVRPGNNIRAENAGFAPPSITEASLRR